MTRISDTGVTLNLRNGLDEVRDKFSGMYHMDIVYDDCCANPDSIVECMFADVSIFQEYKRFICIAYEKEHASQSVRDIIDLHGKVASGGNHVSYIAVKLLYTKDRYKEIDTLHASVIDYIVSNMQFDASANVLQVTTMYDVDVFLMKWKSLYGILMEVGIAGKSI